MRSHQRVGRRRRSSAVATVRSGDPPRALVAGHLQRSWWSRARCFHRTTEYNIFVHWRDRLQLQGADILFKGKYLPQIRLDFITFLF